MAKLAIKSDNRTQPLLFPPTLDELVPKNHLVRVEDAVIDTLDIGDILATYSGGGSAYSPRMMLKVIVFAYLCNVYPSRRIAELLAYDIRFMWLAGLNRPDFRTINLFRGRRMKDGINSVFTQVVQLLQKKGFVSLKVQYIDGTKIESAANKYTFVWRGSVEKNDAKLKKKVGALLDQIEKKIAVEEVEIPCEGGEMSAEEAERRTEQIKNSVNAEKLDKKDLKAIKKIEEEAVPRMKKYEKQLKTMGGRNSYSKTDPDATFMRMKEDAMGNGQLKPGYNVQIATENQFVTNFGIYQNPGDPLTMADFLEGFEKRYRKQSEEACADSGYGSEENYEYMFAHGITPFVKYNMFHAEQHRKYKNNPFLVQNLFCNAEKDFYVCPMGQHMNLAKTEVRKNANGYPQMLSTYRAERCEGCPLRGQCHKAKGNRQIEVNHILNRYKAEVRELLTSEEGLKHRSKRPIEPEAVFGQIKQNGGFRRLRLRGIAGANIEFGLKAVAHNIKKMFARRGGQAFFCKTRVKIWLHRGCLRLISAPESAENENLAVAA